MEQEKPQYTEEELERYEKRGAKITDKGWLQSEDGQLIIPESAQWKILKGLHESFHLGAESTYQMASHLFEGKNVMENSKRDGNTRPPDLPVEKPICRSGSNS